MKILLATRNPHKIREIGKIFSVPGIEFATLEDFPDLPEVVEDRDTFAGNAAKKAVTLAKIAGLMAMADDSGLEVYALGGAPGVYSARYAGTHGDDRANNEKLLADLAGAGDRSARFRCVISLADPNGRCDSVEGICAGRIATERCGYAGFGYDPVFIPAGYNRTFAEMEPGNKNRISNRARALNNAREAWLSKQQGRLVIPE